MCLFTTPMTDYGKAYLLASLCHPNLFSSTSDLLKVCGQVYGPLCIRASKSRFPILSSFPSPSSPYLLEKQLQVWLDLMNIS